MQRKSRWLAELAIVLLLKFLAIFWIWSAFFKSPERLDPDVFSQTLFGDKKEINHDQ